MLTIGAFRRSVLVTFQFAAWIRWASGLVLGVALASPGPPAAQGHLTVWTIFSTVATSVAVSSLMWLTLFNPSVGVFDQFLSGWAATRCSGYS